MCYQFSMGMCTSNIAQKKLPDKISSSGLRRQTELQEDRKDDLADCLLKWQTTCNHVSLQTRSRTCKCFGGGLWKHLIAITGKSGSVDDDEMHCA